MPKAPSSHGLLVQKKPATNTYMTAVHTEFCYLLKDKCPLHAKKTYGGVDVQLHSFLTLGARWR
jgi:hypothetical protein